MSVFVVSQLSQRLRAHPAEATLPNYAQAAQTLAEENPFYAGARQLNAIAAQTFNVFAQQTAQLGEIIFALARTSAGLAQPPAAAVQSPKATLRLYAVIAQTYGGIAQWYAVAVQKYAQPVQAYADSKQLYAAQVQSVAAPMQPASSGFH